MVRSRFHLTVALLALALTPVACVPIGACDSGSSLYDRSQSAAYAFTLTCLSSYTPDAGLAGPDAFGSPLFDAPAGTTSAEATVTGTVLPRPGS